MRRFFARFGLSWRFLLVGCLVVGITSSAVAAWLLAQGEPLGLGGVFALFAIGILYLLIMLVPAAVLWGVTYWLTHRSGWPPRRATVCAAGTTAFVAASLPLALALAEAMPSSVLNAFVVPVPVATASAILFANGLYRDLADGDGGLAEVFR
ncbi:MAG: hypothetical protein AAGI50_19870 [Pseudomonadota bacterium]